MAEKKRRLLSLARFTDFFNRAHEPRAIPFVDRSQIPPSLDAWWDQYTRECDEAAHETEYRKNLVEQALLHELEKKRLQERM